MALIEKHNIQFILLQPFDIRLFNEMIDKYPNNVRATDIGGAIIIRIYR
jgi:hypothetical protein